MDIIARLSKKRDDLYKITALALIGLSGSCTYRFTNTHIELPPGINNIAFEAIYDTSREVLPHEILWESLQRSFAADGHLQIVSQGRADALLRAHIISAAVNPTGSATENLPQEDSPFENADDTPPPPDQFRIMSQAGEYTTKEAMQIKVQIQVINLYTQQTIFQKVYSEHETFGSSRGEGDAQKKSLYLLYEEALQADFKRMADRISEEVVRDFIVGR